MRTKESIFARRKTLLFIALFSCIQIISGFFLIIGGESHIVPAIQNERTQDKKLAFKNITKIASINTHSINTD